MFMAIGATAQNTVEQRDHVMTASPMAREEHLAHLREFLAANSSHGPVIPESATIHTEAVQNIALSAKSFAFTPSSFTVNQGDLVNITFSVPSNDPAPTGHGLLMETYVESAVEVKRPEHGDYVTATTSGSFQYACSVSECGTGHSSMAD